MLSEEEKKAIKKLNEILKEWQEIINIEDETEREIEMLLYLEEMPFEEINTVLNLITKLQKENEKKDKRINRQFKLLNKKDKEINKLKKQIDLMADKLVDAHEWFYSEFDNFTKEDFIKYFEKEAKKE